MKKLFNIRPIVVLSCFFILGILSAVYFRIVDNLLLCVLLGLVLIVVCAILDLFVFKKLKFLRSEKFYLLVVSALISFLVSYFVTDLSLSRKASDDIGNGLYYISATVDEVGESFVVLDDIKLDDRSSSHYKLNGKVIMFYDNDEGLGIEEGNTIVFFGSYNYTFDLNDENCLKYISSGTVGRVAGVGNIEVVEDSVSVRAKVLRAFDNSYGQSMSKENSSIAKAFLFGDKSDFSKEVETVFSNAGVMHLFAVSGLHIGFLCSILTMLLSKLFKNKKVCSIIIFALLFVYSWICGFSPSVTRALIMMGVVMMSQIFGRQYDGINSLALASLIILIISPFQLFSVGFILSFCAVLSIFCFEPMITCGLAKFLPGKFASYISVTLAAQVGTVPVVAYYFSTIQLGSIFANVLSVYVATLTFSLLVASFILSLIFPVLSVLFVVPNFLLTILCDISHAISILDINISVGHFPVAFMYLVVLGLFLGGEYSFLKRKWVYIVGAYVLFICGIVLL